ncbi:sodium channel protein type 4 subunit alpha B-like [Pelmatolapia mariae]|uniref:sodium channel protein type 4 subunit alpha B-like n=1 Tax=Pelmatolapia mariae TaxID=158779 RepID=UPI002FE6378D
MSFFDLWSRTKERGALVRRANQLRLNPSQLTLLLGDNQIRAALQDDSMVSLLPPVGTEVFRHFTTASQEVQQQHVAEAKERKTWKDKRVTEKNLPKPAAHLETGKSLPLIYGDPPPQLLNTPLEDLDPFYQSRKTFVVLSKGNIINRFSADSSCYLLSPFNPLRTLAIKTLLHPYPL